MFKIIIIILIIIILIFIINHFDIIKTEYFKNSSYNKSLKKKYYNKNNNNSFNNNLIENKILFNNKDYNQNLSIDNKDNQYFYTDMIDQSKINESAFNIIYSIDPIDYSNVKTGLQKCNEQCKGICFENGYDGTSTCYPLQTQIFDWGTLYKNPTFTYGYNAYGPDNLSK